MHVLVVGAGCTGLLIAQGLRSKPGLTCTVYERAPEDRATRDWSMMLHWGAEFLKRHLSPEILNDLPMAQADPWIELSDDEKHNLPIFNGKTGEVLVKTKMASSTRYSRAKLCALLKRGVDVRYGKQLVGINVTDDMLGNSVEAVFADGETAQCDQLVGADSANSFVRSWLLGDDKAKCSELSQINYNFKVSYPAEYARWLREQPHRLMRCAPHPDQNTWYMISTCDIPDPDQPEEWVFQHFMNLSVDSLDEQQKPSEDSKERLRHFKELGSVYAEPWRSAVKQVPDDTFVPFDRIKYWEHPIRWESYGGRITLAGDAAHPMTPHRGQGLNQSMLDSAELVDTIVGISQAASLEEQGKARVMGIVAYEDKMFERGKREIEASCWQSYTATHFARYLESPNVKYGHSQMAKDAVLGCLETARS